MSPSSLIFVLVVAVWAAYLVVDTTRRREYLATAQSVDRFSASMRVLQRRAVRRESAEAFEASTAPMRSTSSVLLHRVPTASRAATEARAAEAAVRPLTSGRHGGTSGLAARQQAATRLRRARALAVATFVLALATLVSAVVAGFGLVSWAVPVGGVVLSTLTVVLMRREATRAKAVRKTTRTGSSAVRPAARAAASTAPVVAEAARTEQVEVDVLESRPVARAMPVAQEYVPFDYAREVEPIIRAEDEALAHTLARESDPLHGTPGWAPVPVPPPTYTLKARAERPMPPPLDIEQDYYDLEPVELEWDAVDDVYYRAAGQ